MKTSRLSVLVGLALAFSSVGCGGLAVSSGDGAVDGSVDGTVDATMDLGSSDASVDATTDLGSSDAPVDAFVLDLASCNDASASALPLGA